MIENKESFLSNDIIMLPIGATVVCFNILAFAFACALKRVRIYKKNK